MAKTFAASRYSRMRARTFHRHCGRAGRGSSFGGDSYEEPVRNGAPGARTAVIRINVVAFENGVGNSRDLELVSHALAEADCTVNVTRISAHTRRRPRSPVLRGLVAARGGA